MSNIEHYFENLLLEGKDCEGEPNKKALTQAEQKAVEECADFVIYTIFRNRENLIEYKNDTF